MSKSKMYRSILLLMIICTVITIWIYKIINEKVPYVDQLTRGFVDFVAPTKIYDFARFITNFGSASFLIPFTVVIGLVMWFLYKDWLPALFIWGGTLGSHLFNLFVKQLVARERPRIYVEANAEGFSFPSGHSMIPMVCYGLVMYFIVKKIPSMKIAMVVQIGFSLLIFLIGISRYLINVHYLTDVLTGFMVGYLLLISFIHLFKILQKRRMQP
ncbi:MAG TPA: phosphatase PAP2 family protein [Virgibacillus sp.]|nr:phosphatase PAP2 family protein [Virgibacillus sp.]